MNQSILDRAVRIATKCALNGNPVARVIWLEPSTASSDPAGVFAIEYARKYSGSETPIWEQSI